MFTDMDASLLAQDTLRGFLPMASRYATAPDQIMAELLPALSKSILTKGGRRLPGQSLRSILGRYGRQIQQLPANRTMNAGEAVRRFADATTYRQQDINQNALVRQIFEDVTGRPWPW